MDVVLDNWRQLADGLGVTLTVTAGAATVATIVAFVMGLARLAPVRACRVAAMLFIEFFRGTSALVQLFWLFFVLPLWGVTLSPLLVGIVGLGLCVGAYGAEIVRSCIVGVDPAQRAAAAALGLTSSQTFRLVVLPLALPPMIPPFGNLLIELLKLTALVSLVTLSDLTFIAQSLNATTYETGPIFTTILVIYFIVGSALAALMRGLERAVMVGGLQAQRA